ncbi:hypothetical protein [Halobacterium jilantaiense]|uniref:Uncharacterized protein n=1 Tax=Halobacterium jilantaiense TaxID=355548 RepID=A0A1I0MW39_9EURY|nr:hypothetical protein [Halobacterium jilantaiense]SEV93005.1 hypothetical protein SAMN04487945_0422 [Halobacterium jilantaiense]
MTGTLSGTQRCGDLSVESNYFEESKHVVVDVTPVDTVSCPNCTRYYQYEAAVSFRERPSSIYLAHWESYDQLGDWWSMGVNATNSDTA